MTSPGQNGARAPLRFIVLQPGARMHYAVPALLARAGMLERFYTDICADVGLLRHLGPMWPERMRPWPVARLLGRRLPREVPARRVRQVPLASFAHLALRHFPHRQRYLNRWTGPDHRMTELVRRDGFASADALYTVLINSDLDLVRDARARGLRTVHEVMMAPDIGRWMQEEQSLYPGIEESLPPERIRAGNERDAKKYELSDLILVPSEFVRRSVLALGGDPERIATVPYGLDERWLDLGNESVPGRVLFVRLRKAAQRQPLPGRSQSHPRAAPCRLRGQGGRVLLSDAVSHPAFDGPTYVGQVPRSRILDEFSRADVFVLPTLCDSFALAHLEAMACGVPVITTPNCGSVVRDGVDGFIVPIRDVAAVADKVELLLTDRALRARMGRSARERAQEFTWARYGERLRSALNTLAR